MTPIYKTTSIINQLETSRLARQYRAANGNPPLRAIADKMGISLTLVHAMLNDNRKWNEKYFEGFVKSVDGLKK